MKRIVLVFSGVLVALLAWGVMTVARVAAATACESLAGLKLPHTTITSAESVAAGAFTPPGGRGAARADLSAFCRVAATLTPSADSDIKIEVWMPTSTWNGKYEAVGNGGWNGAIGYTAMMAALGRGYATSSTDTGHAGDSAEFALGHPEKLIDFGYRSVHEMTLTAKAIVGAYYGVQATRAYWSGCSAGGRQAMKEAQLYPSDFDGIIAGAPGLDWTGRAAGAVRIAQVAQDQNARISAATAQLIHAAAVDACDALDGVKDGIIDDPTKCTFDPGVLVCKGGERPDCLTEAQVHTARMIYMSPVNPKTKRPITGLAPGSELGWTDQGWSVTARSAGLGLFRFVVYKDPAWDIGRFNFETDIVRAEADLAATNALDPNLKPFFERGGKLLHYHGWSDPQISPGNSTQYFTRVADALGGVANVQRSYRLFMAPGMGHCGGGEGPNTFDMLSALEQWVENGKAPDRIVASRSRDGKVERTRPLCPYPQKASYTGRGSTDEHVNFVCVP